jgi:thioredoxin-related protein
MPSFSCRFNRRDLLKTAMAVCACQALSHASSAATRELPVSKSLFNDLAVALKTSKPLLVLVSLDNCPFCKIARENYLIPLMTEQSLCAVQVNLNHSTPIDDAQGKRTTQGQLIRTWAIRTTPTVLFLGKNGQEISPRLEGGSTSDFYGAYLQERIDQAIKLLQTT